MPIEHFHGPVSSLQLGSPAFGAAGAGKWQQSIPLFTGTTESGFEMLLNEDGNGFDC